jgi:alpha-1,6-mannosyltransferase
MKIVDVCAFYSATGGGVRAYVDEKFAAAERHGHTLSVIAPGAAHHVEARGKGRVVWVPGPFLPFDHNYRVFREAQPVWDALDAERPDVVEASSPWRAGWLAGKWPGKAARSLVFHQDFVAAYAHTYLDRALPRPAIDMLFAPYWRYARALSNHFDVTVTGGAWLTERLRRHGLHRPHTVPFGVPPNVFSAAHRDEALRRELLARCGVGPDARLLLMVSRMHPEKRHATVLRAFAQARRHRPMGLVLIGGGFNRARVEKLAQQAGHVHMAGAVTDRALLARMLASGDLLVHGSGAETYGFAVAEAMLSGLPAVLPDSGGAVDFATAGRTRVYATGNAASCAAAILDMLDMPPGAPPPDHIGTLDDHFAKLFALYEDLRARPR